jgi:outer membrane receptor for ferrienterochelin and colicin
MKKFFYMFLMLSLAAAPLSAKKTEDLLMMETEDLFDLSLEELLDIEITSAGKMAEKVSEIPAGVYIVTRQNIEAYGYRTVAEVIRNIPGFYTIYDYQDDVIGLRGLLNEDNMIILINNVVHPTSDINEIMVPTEAIDRIEVVRGPMSVIYGSGAFLGSINIVTNHIPCGDPLNMVSAFYGSLNTYKLFARTSAEEGGFKYTLNASTYGSDGIQEDYEDMMGQRQSTEVEKRYPDAHKKTDGDLERKSSDFNFSAAYKDFYADFQYNESDKGIFESLSFHEGSTREIKIATGQIGWRHDLIPTIRTDGKITYSHIKMEELYDYFDPHDFGHGSVANGFGEEKHLEAELDFIWKPLPEFNMITGFNYKRKLDPSFHADYPMPPEFGEERIIAQYTTTDQDTRSLFVQMNYKPFEKLKLTAGARLEQYLSFDSESFIQYPDEKLSLRDSFNTDEEVYFIPRAAAVWSLTDHHILKLMYGEANKPFSDLEVALFELQWGIIAELEPEEIETVELNYLMVYPNYSLSLSLFRNNIENLLSTRFMKDEDGEFIPVRDNSGRMVTYGGEFILTAAPIENLSLELSAAYQETEDRTYKKRKIPFSPHLLMKAKADYRWDGFTVGLSGMYVDEMEPERSLEDPNGWRLKSSDEYVIADLNLRYDDAETGIFAAFKISNLFDQEVRYPATEEAQFVNGLIDEGRGFMGTIGWKF